MVSPGDASQRPLGVPGSEALTGLFPRERRGRGGGTGTRLEGERKCGEWEGHEGKREREKRRRRRPRECAEKKKASSRSFPPPTVHSRRLCTVAEAAPSFFGFTPGLFSRGGRDALAATDRRKGRPRGEAKWPRGGCRIND